MTSKVSFRSVCILLVLPLLVSAGKPSAVKWVKKSPFEQKVFIENKGQYALKNKGLSTSDIFFSADLDGLQYYFTKNSIWIEHDQIVNRTEQEMEQLKAQHVGLAGPGNGLNLQYKIVKQTYRVYFDGANTSVQIRGADPVTTGYNFRTGDKTSVRAQGYKKVVYTNLYPGIDMEFYFPEDKQGYEYDFIVHPGADVSQIKIQYPLNEGISSSGDGNLVIRSAFGDFIEHTPVASLASQALSCSFAVQKGIVQFNTANYDKSKSLTIDPWVTDPHFTAKDDANYVDFDDAGNCYVYGGGNRNAAQQVIPYQLQKYDPNGNLLYSYQVPITIFNDSAQYLDYDGHFAVDRVTQSVYIVEGYTAYPGGAKMIKLNQTLSLVATYAGNAKEEALWRIAFSRCNPHQGVVGGGNSSTTAPYYNGFSLDTTLNTITPVNSANAVGYQDACLLTLDNSGNAYMAISDPLNIFNNAIVKLPAPTMTGPIWKVADGYGFRTAASVYPGSSGNDIQLPNGFSGMAFSTGNDLFTYDSYVLKKWDASTGNLLLRKRINTPGGGDSLHMYWAGLTTDVCDNMFLGSNESIQQYDGNLNAVGAPIAAPDTVFDIKLGDYNVLYACGVGFVEAIQVNLPFCVPFSADTSTVSATCYRKGKASVSVKTGMASSIEWTELGSTTLISTDSVVDSLREGTYVVTLIDSSCLSERIMDTVHVLRTAISPDVNNPSIGTCFGTPVTLTATGATGYSWFPSTALSATSGSSVTANPAVTTSYTLIGFTPGECPDTVYPVVVTVYPLPDIIIQPANPVVCSGNAVTLTVSGAAKYAWSPTTNLIVNDSSAIASPTSSTKYTVTGTSAENCVDSSSIVVNIGTSPQVAFSVTPASQCDPLLLQFNATVFDTGITYLWEFGDNTTSNAIDPQHQYKKAGRDTVKLIETNSQGCTDTLDTVQTFISSTELVVLPNAFTPSAGDGLNDRFAPIVSCTGPLNYIFRVYNRWGQLIFEATSPEDAWDGTYKGKPEPLDVYVYYVEFNCGNCYIFRKGNVTLLR